MRHALVTALAAATLGIGGAQPARPAILGISHVAIQVSDLARARAFYGNLLGFAEATPVRDHAAIFIVNERQRLIVRDGLPAGRDERFLDLAFDSNVAELRGLLLERRLQVSDPLADPEAGGRRIAVTDPDGHAVQFVEPGRPNLLTAAPDRR